jgi:hypothetical protein
LTLGGLAGVFTVSSSFRLSGLSSPLPGIVRDRSARK